MRQQDRHGHELVSLIRRVAEHHSLVAGTADVDAHRDVRRLAIDRTDHRAGLAVESERWIVVADALDRRTNDVRNRNIRRRRDLTRDTCEPGSNERLASNA